MISRIIKKTVDLSKIQKVDQLEGPLYQLENGGHTFEITCLMDGAAAAISGTVSARFLRADEETVYFTGTLNGNVASITLPQSCYNVNGRFGLVVFVSGNDITSAVYAVAGNVYRSTSDHIIDPTEEIPSLEDLIAKISECEEATADAQQAASFVPSIIASTYSTSVAYVVGDYCTYEGAMYRCTAETDGAFDPADWEAVKVGTEIQNVDGQIDDLKSAFEADENAVLRIEEPTDYWEEPTQDTVISIATGVTASYTSNGITLTHATNLNDTCRFKLAGLTAGNSYTMRLKAYYNDDPANKNANIIQGVYRDTHASGNGSRISTFSEDGDWYTTTFTAAATVTGFVVIIYYSMSSVTITDISIVETGDEKKYTVIVPNEVSDEKLADALDIFLEKEEPIEYWVKPTSETEIYIQDGVTATYTDNSITLSHAGSSNRVCRFKLTGLTPGKSYTMKCHATIAGNLEGIYVRTTASSAGVVLATFSNVSGWYVATFNGSSDVMSLNLKIWSSQSTITVSDISITETGAVTEYSIKIPVKLSNADYDGNEFRVFKNGLCIGDSMTVGVFNTSLNPAAFVTNSDYSYPVQLEKMSSVNITTLGRGGITSVEWASEYADTDVSGYDFAIIQLGINDAITYESWTSASETAFETIINKLQTANSGIKIFVATLVPGLSYKGTKYDAVSTGIRNLVETLADDNVILMDIAQYSHVGDEDGYNYGHLTAAGYRRLAQDYYAMIGYYINQHLSEFKFVQFIGTQYAD